jgi:hypothetical protein
MPSGSISSLASTFDWHPSRILAALVATLAVLVSSTVVWVVSARFGPAVPLIPAIIGGLFAFNTLLFFPPTTLASNPRRFVPVLAANLLPVPVTTLLYHVSPILADVLLVAVVGLSVLARPARETIRVVALIVAINTIVALVLGAGIYLVPVGIVAGVFATPIAFLADGAAATLLHRYGATSERPLLLAALSAFLAELARAWHSDADWPTHRLQEQARRIQTVWSDFLLGGLPPPAPQGIAFQSHGLVEAIAISAGELHRYRADMRPDVRQILETTLTVLADSASTASVEPARAAVQALEAAARQPPSGQDNVRVLSRLLSLALLLSDLFAAEQPIAARTFSLAPGG